MRESPLPIGGMNEALCEGFWGLTGTLLLMAGDLRACSARMQLRRLYSTIARYDLARRWEKEDAPQQRQAAVHT